MSLFLIPHKRGTQDRGNATWTTNARRRHCDGRCHVYMLKRRTSTTNSSVCAHSSIRRQCKSMLRTYTCLAAVYRQRAHDGSLTPMLPLAGGEHAPAGARKRSISCILQSRSIAVIGTAITHACTLQRQRYERCVQALHATLLIESPRWVRADSCN